MRNIEERLTPEQKQMARRRRILQGRAAQGTCIFAALLAVSLLFFRSNALFLTGTQHFFPAFFIAVFNIFRTFTNKAAYISIFFENKKSISHLVHKIAVMAYNQKATLILHQKLLQNIHRKNIKVISRLIKNQKIRVSHQKSYKEKPFPFTTTQ